jgi:GntR family transcriptional regulator
MTILLSNQSGPPIYQQIFDQVRDQILSGDLPPGTALPSIRALAKDLRVSVITTKRAYDELEAAGYLYTVPGKGCYVAQADTQRIREGYLTQIEDHLTQAISLARTCDLRQEELLDLLRLLWADPQP